MFNLGILLIENFTIFPVIVHKMQTPVTNYHFSEFYICLRVLCMTDLWSLKKGKMQEIATTRLTAFLNHKKQVDAFAFTCQQDFLFSVAIYL